MLFRAGAVACRCNLIGFSGLQYHGHYQIELCPEIHQRLAFSALIKVQNVFSFGISSALGNFQNIMDSLTSDLPGLAVYVDDILASGYSAGDHQRLLRCLHEMWLRCQLLELYYLGNTLS